MLQRIANLIVLQWGWKRAAIAFFAGAVSAAAQPPFHLFPVLWLTFPVLVWLIDGAVEANARGRLSRLRPAALVGWWFGFGYFLAGLWWLGSAFLVEAETFAWLLPLAVVALPAGLALFWALAVAAARMFWTDSPARIVVLALALGLAELARGLILTGFPWNAIGQGLAANTVQMQFAALIGIESMSILAVFIFAAPAILIDEPQRQRARFALVAAAVLSYSAVLGFGAFRLAKAELLFDDDIRLRVVQPAIAQSEKWKPENRKRIFETLLRLSDQATSPDRLGMISVTHLVWPESAFPFVLTDHPDALTALSNLLPPGTVLLTGAIRTEPSGRGGRKRYFNSIYVIDHDGVILDAYDKNDLVPFGEFLPFQDLMETAGLQQLTRIAGGFSSGARRKPLMIPGAPPAIPLICYEIIFPGRSGGDTSGWILNVTNDAWFGNTPGPYQHLHQARIRAVEEGKPVVRAANTGISAVIDPYGRLVRKLGLNVAGVIDASLPRSIEQSPVVNHRYLMFAGISVFMILLIVLIGRKTHFQSRK